MSHLFVSRAFALAVLAIAHFVTIPSWVSGVALLWLAAGDLVLAKVHKDDDGL